MAEVYRGRDVALGRDVAVKVLPSTLAQDTGYVERFRDEARRVATLSHVNVVPVYYYGEERGLLYLVMPILRESLRDRMDREGTLPPSDAAKLVVQIAAALDAAHGHGIIHRDVKPENILLNHEGKAHLTDFGIARELSFLRESGTNRTLAASGLPVGTPEYMAPEQLRAGNVDERSDIYSLGTVLYELLTGNVPHEGPTPYEVAALVLTAPVVPPSVHNPAIWPELEQVVMKALAKDAADRFPDARSFAMALRRAVLQRDPNAPRLTMPASRYTLGPLMPLPMPGTGPLGAGMQAASPYASPVGSGTLVLDAPTTPGGLGGPPAWLPPGAGGAESFPARPQPVGGKKWLVLSAVLVLALVAALGTGGLAILGNLTGPGGITNPPVGNGIAGGPAHATASAHATETVGAMGGSATVTPSAGANSTPNPNATATATPSPQPGPSLSFSPSQFTLSSNGSGSCTGTQSIYNGSGNSLTWTWTVPQPRRLNPSYTVTRPDGTRVSSGTWPPKDTANGGLPSGAVDTLTLSTSCNGNSYTITVSDSGGGSYTFTLTVEGGGGGG
jgi:hypothetical protein